jgi:CBS-domain-containing membrane protein
MQRHVHSVSMDDTAAQVEALFVEHKLLWAPVVNPEGDIVGVISQTDLTRLRAMMPSLSSMQAWQLCTYKPITVESDTSVEAVARLMTDAQIHHVVVLEQGRVAGVVSSLDLLRALVG